jgi:hypothetical protein
MATRTIPARVETDDDFTGKPVTGDQTAVKVEISVKVNGKAIKAREFDAAHVTADALTAFVSDPTDENRRNLGALIPRPVVGRSGSGNSSGKMTAKRWARETEAGQEWAKAHPDVKIDGAGAPAADLAEAFDKANSAS